MIWFTVDVEEIEDMNFGIKWKSIPKLDYEMLIGKFIDIMKDKKDKTAFVLGSFAKKYPNIVRKLSLNGIEIASHGMYHNLVYKESFQEWSKNISDAKKIIEDITSEEVKGYRSPSWSMPFEKRYYEELVKAGFSYSSSYFPMKNYMYGNSINKKEPFYIYTPSGKIEERPIPKYIIPYSGGFYLRVLPLWFLKIAFKKSERSVLYIHPYELEDRNLVILLRKYAKINPDYILAFFSLGKSSKKLKEISALG